MSSATAPTRTPTSARASTRDHALVQQHRASITVAALAATLGVALVQGTGLLQAAIEADVVTGNSRTVAALLQLTGPIFILLALYAGGVVTTNTFSMVVAGRAPQVALRRLLGSTARRERRAVAREGFQVGLVGALLGLIVGSGLVAVLLAVGRLTGLLHGVTYSLANPAALVPAVAVVPTTWIAAVVGSRGVLKVTPIQSLHLAQEPSEDEARASRARSAIAIALIAVGVLLLAGGVALGRLDTSGFAVAFFGGLLSFTGIALGGHLIVPRALRLVGLLTSRSATARLAAENAIRYPLRSTRSTIGLLIAVTLITTFGVGLATLAGMLQAAAATGAPRYVGIDDSLTMTIVVFSILTGLSAVIAGAGLVNALSLSVAQRTRELGLLRALGFSRTQLQRMVLAESGQLVFTAVTLGLILGTVYGWAGAHALLGTQDHMPDLLFVTIPWGTVAAIAVGGLVLTVLASLAPARRATRVQPVVALAADG